MAAETTVGAVLDPPPPTPTTIATRAAAAVSVRRGVYKVLVVGPSRAGKTCFIRRLSSNEFQLGAPTTTAVDFHRCEVRVLGKPVSAQLWDTAGQERFLAITTTYCSRSDGAFIVFDITDPASFDAVLDWKKIIDRETTQLNKPGIPCWLIAHKCDLELHCKTNGELENLGNDSAFDGYYQHSHTGA
ncbi:ADP ribosylation factor [Pelomyxa schiedti]|nr:ADP ribosylation factor [Pelomyxa schiedti]